MAVTVDRIQEILFNNEAHGPGYPMVDYRKTAMHVAEDLPHMEDGMELEELLYDLLSLVGSEDYEDLALQIWEEHVGEDE